MVQSPLDTPSAVTPPGRGTMDSSQINRQNNGRTNSETVPKNGSGPRFVRGWRIAFLVVCTVAVCLSADLLRLHVNVHTDPEYQSYCAMSERVNCETVALSDYALLWGMPVATWGLLAYLIMGALAIWGLRGHLRTASWPFGALFGLSIVASVVGVALAVISHVIIESVCIVCACTYVVNFGLLFTAFMALRRARVGPTEALAAEARSVVDAPRHVTIFACTAAVVTVAVWVTIPPYWRVGGTIGPSGLSVGVTRDGHPWIGATNPVLEIIEFSDYQCPYCQRGHDDIRKLLIEHPNEVRLVHRNYPLDDRCNKTLKRPFHPKACDYAVLAHCAAAQGKFWEANDYLFANGRRREPITAKELAAAVGISASRLKSCSKGAEADSSVQADLAAGRALKIRGTPTFVVGEHTYPGRIPEDVVKTALRAGSTPGQSRAQ